MKIVVIGESCQDCFILGDSTRFAPDVPCPVFVADYQVNSFGMAANVYRNIQSILSHKYKKDKDEVILLTNQKTRNHISKTRYVIERTNTTLIRIDVGDKNYGHISEHYEHWKEMYDWSKLDGIILSDYNKNFLLENDIKFLASKNNNVFLDTKKLLTDDLVENVKFLKINNFEYDKSKNNFTTNIKDKLIVTLGSNGALYQNDIFPVKRVNIKDTSGAGDTMYAGFVVSYLKTQDIQKSIKFANKMATIVVQKRGVVTPYDNME